MSGVARPPSRLAPALIGVLLLAGCTAPAGPRPLPPSGPITSSPSKFDGEVVLPSPSPVGVPLGAGRGCAPTATTVPAGALTSPIGDIDGDGRPDREWAQLVTGGTIFFGVSTASGATLSALQEFAGGGERRFVAGRLADGITVLLPSERSTPLWSFTRCSLHRVRGTYVPGTGVGQRGAFTLFTNEDGGSAGCLDGRLVGLHRRPSGRDRTTVTATQVTISRDGTRATVGPTSTVVRRVPDRTGVGAGRIGRYLGVSCGWSKVLVPPATVPGH